MLRRALMALLLWGASGVALADFNGYHDVGNCSVVSGWAWDSTQPTGPVSVDIYVDGTLAGTVQAATFRQDLLNAGIGNGSHGFSIATPGAAINGQAHTITVKYAGTQTNLNNTPKAVSCIAPGVPTPQYSGYHDVGNCSVIAGWAWDANQPTTPVSVDIYVDGALVSTTQAATFRQDLLNAGIGDGNHGFSIATPGAAINGQAHTVTVKYAGTQTNLNNTPKAVSCIAPGVPTPQYEGYHDGASCTAINGWAWDSNQPAGPVSVDIYSDGVLVATTPANQFRADLLAAGKGNGVHAFSLATPGALKDNQVHSIVVKYAGTQTNLNSTPKPLQCAPSGAQAYYIFPDHLGTPRLIQDQLANTVWQWDNQEPFGNDVPNANPAGAGPFEFNLRFPGQYYDRETNLAYNYFRDYDPAAGRYIQSDPIGAWLYRDMAFRSLGNVAPVNPKFTRLLYSALPRYNHVYGYAMQNPLSYSDLFGLDPLSKDNRERGERADRERPGDSTGSSSSSISGSVGMSPAQIAQCKACREDAMTSCLIGGGICAAGICGVATTTIIGGLVCAAGGSTTVSGSCWYLTDLYCSPACGVK